MEGRRGEVAGRNSKRMIYGMARCQETKATTTTDLVPGFFRLRTPASRLWTLDSGITYARSGNPASIQGRTGYLLSSHGQGRVRENHTEKGVAKPDGREFSHAGIFLWGECGGTLKDFILRDKDTL